MQTIASQGEHNALGKHHSSRVNLSHYGSTIEVLPLALTASLIESLYRR
jgi:hypothetical protein